MAGMGRRFVVYSKVAVLGVLTVLVVVFAVKNCRYETQFWPGAVGEPVPTLWLILMTSVTSVVVFWILSRMRRIFKDLAELRAERAAADLLASQEQRKQELLEQEKRIEEKLRQAAAGSEDDKR